MGLGVRVFELVLLGCMCLYGVWNPVSVLYGAKYRLDGRMKPKGCTTEALKLITLQQKHYNFDASHPKLSTLNPKPLNPKPETLNPKTPKPKTPKPRNPQTLTS